MCAHTGYQDCAASFRSIFNTQHRLHFCAKIWIKHHLYLLNALIAIAKLEQKYYTLVTDWKFQTLCEEPLFSKLKQKHFFGPFWAAQGKLHVFFFHYGDFPLQSAPQPQQKMRGNRSKVTRINGVRVHSPREHSGCTAL